MADGAVLPPTRFASRSPSPGTRDEHDVVLALTTFLMMQPL